MSRNNPNDSVVYLRWSEALNDWIVCNSFDKGAIPFHKTYKGLFGENLCLIEQTNLVKK